MRHVAKVRRARRGVLAEVEGLLRDVTIAQDGIGYPSLRGRWGEHTVKLDLVVDTLAMRQVPTLWMLVSVLRPLPVRTPVDITLRPRPSDVVSAGMDFAYEHPAPAAWPPDIRVATPEPALPPLEELDGLTQLLCESSTKGVLIAPGGVRVVHELARGAIGHYRVSRRPRFSFTVEPQRVLTLLRVAEATADRIESLEPAGARSR